MTTEPWRERLDISEALKADGWIPDDENPLEILRKNDVTWAIANDCGDSQLDGSGGWSVPFASDVPVVVVVSACLAAVGTPRLSLVVAG